MHEYILIFTAEFGTPNVIQEFLESHGVRCMAVTGLPFCLFLLSNINNANELAQLLHGQFPGRFAVFSATDRQGWMPSTLWDFYNGEDTQSTNS